jgi:restriction system protein
MSSRYRRKKNSDFSQIFILVILILGISAFFYQWIPQGLDIYLSLVYLLAFLLVILGVMFLFHILRRERKLLKAFTVSDVDHMSGVNFERYIGEILKSQGYHISYTPITGDYGTDIVAQKGNKRISVQLKRYGKPVGPSAIQQAVASMVVYGCNETMVVTNNTYTKEAKKLAEYNNCVLINRNQLGAWIIAFQEKE